jgi:hypothetical protein
MIAKPRMMSMARMRPESGSSARREQGISVDATVRLRYRPLLLAARVVVCDEPAGAIIAEVNRNTVST